MHAYLNAGMVGEGGTWGLCGWLVGKGRGDSVVEGELGGWFGVLRGWDMRGLVFVEFGWEMVGIAFACVAGYVYGMRVVGMSMWCRIMLGMCGMDRWNKSFD